MAEPLEAELDLDFSSTADALESAIQSALEAATESFATALADAVSGVTASVADLEAPLTAAGEALGTALDTSITDAAATVPDLETPMQGVGDALGTSLDDAITTAGDALTGLEATVTVAEVDTAPIDDAITSAIDETDTTVIVDGVDTSAITEEIAEAAAAIEPIDVEMNVDTGDSGADLAELDAEAGDAAESVEQAANQASKAGPAFNSLGSAATITSGAFDIANRNGKGFVGTAGQVGGAAGKMAAGIVGVGVAFSTLFSAGQKAVAANERLNIVFGQTAGAVQKINVGGLTGDMSKLANTVGSSGTALKTAASSLGTLGTSAGKTRQEIVPTVQQVSALALRAVALNPALGEAGAVMEKLNLALGRGGPRLAKYGISLTALEIGQRAMADTGKTATSQLTAFDKTAAAAAITTERLGKSLATDFEKGSKQAAVQFKALAATAKEALGKLGAPLVKPMLDAFKSMQPVITAVAEVLGKLASGVMPIVAAAFTTIGSAVTPLVSAIGSLPGPLVAAGAAALILGRNLGGGGGLGQMSMFATSGMDKLKAGVGRLGTALGGGGGGEGLAIRAGVALAAMTALDAGLSAMGTSTDDLGIKMAATGAAIGFALGGPWGALAGVIAGGILDMASATTELDDQLASIDDSFGSVNALGKELATVLYADATAADELTKAMDKSHVALTKWLENKSKFAAGNRNQDDDLKKLGVSWGELATLEQSGEQGLVKFFNTAAQGHPKMSNLRAALKDQHDAFKGNANGAQAYTTAMDHVNTAQHKLGVGAKITGAEFVSLNAKQRQTVLSTLQHGGANADLVASFVKVQRGLQAAGRSEFELFVAANQVSPAIARQAKEVGGVDGKTRDWDKSLRSLQEGMRGAGPAVRALGEQTAISARVYGELGTAIDGAVKGLPTLGSVFDKVAQQTADFGGVTVDTAQAITDGLGTAAKESGDFFANVSKIMQEGKPALAAALLELGPDNLGAVAAANLVASGQVAGDGWEQGLQSLAKGQIVIETVMAQQRTRITFLASALGDDAVTAYAQSKFGQGELGKLTGDQLKDVAEHYMDAPGQIGIAATALFNSINEAEVAAIDAGTPAVVAASDAQVAAYLTALSASKQGVIGEWGAIGQSGVDAITPYTGIFGITGGEAGGAWGTGVATAAPAAASGGDALGSASLGATGGWIPQFAVAGGQAGAGWGQGVKEKEPDARGAGTVISAATVAEGTRHTGLMAEAGRALGSAFARAINGTSGEARGAGKAIVTAASEATRNTGLFKTAGTACGNSYADAVKGAAGAAKGAGRALVEAAAGATRDTGLFAAAGAAAGDAYAAALGAKAGAARTAGHSIASAAAAGAATASPDAVVHFANMGREQALAYAKGIASGAAAAGVGGSALSSAVAGGLGVGGAPRAAPGSVGAVGGGGASFSIGPIEVHGVADKTQARTVGDTIADSVVDGLTRRRIVLAGHG